MVLSRHVAPCERIFTLPLASSILLLPSQNPSPFLLVPLFSVRHSGGRYFCGHLVPAEPGHASSFFFFCQEVLPALLRDVQVLRGVAKQPVTPSTLCLVTSGSGLTGEKG